MTTLTLLPSKTPISSKTPRSAFTKLMKSEMKMSWRVPIGLLGGVVAPIVLVVIFGSLPGMNHAESQLGGLTYFTAYFPIVIAISVSVIALVSLPTRLANFRELGILRRLSTTPVPPSWMLGAQFLMNLAMAVVALGVVVLLGTTQYGLGMPKQLGGFVLSAFLTVAAMFAIGLWLSAWARSTGVANVVGQVMLYPMWFFAGLWGPQAKMGPLLRDIAGMDPPRSRGSGASEIPAGRVPFG